MRKSLLFLAPLAALLAACDTTASSDSSGTVEASTASDAALEAAARTSDGYLDDSDLVLLGEIQMSPTTPSGAARLGNSALRLGVVVAEPDTSENLDAATGWWVRQVSWSAGTWIKTDSIHVHLADVGVRAVADLRCDTVVSRVSGPSRSERWSVLDGDGDGWVLGNAEEEKKIVVRLSVATGDRVETVRMQGDAGPDGSVFDGEDNRIASLEWLRTRDADTVSWVRLSPVEGDVLFGSEAVDSSFFRVDCARFGTLVLQRRVTLWVRQIAGDTAVVGASGFAEHRSGRVDSFALVARDGASWLSQGDTAVFRASSTGGASDSERSSQAEMVYLPGASGEAGRVFSLASQREPREGTLSYESFSWSSTLGASEGERPTDGAFVWTATFRDGGIGTLAGQFTESGFDATWTAPDGTVTTIQR